MCAFSASSVFERSAAWQDALLVSAIESPLARHLGAIHAHARGVPKSKRARERKIGGRKEDEKKTRNETHLFLPFLFLSLSYSHPSSSRDVVRWFGKS